jgi:adenylate cyclase
MRSRHTAAGCSSTPVTLYAPRCNECGAAVATATIPAEYKQVTVLFADVVHSMDIAAAVGAERLREIMTELVDPLHQGGKAPPPPPPPVSLG